MYQLMLRCPPLLPGCLAALLCLWSPIAMSHAPAAQVGRFHLDAPVARVFPLFTALGETAWAQGWDPELLSGREERGSVFRTTHDGRETTWIVIDYRPSQGRVGYARLAHGASMGLVDVHCSPAAGGGTDVSVRYTLTGLTPQGKEFVTGFLDPGRYGRMIEEWRAAIERALSEPSVEAATGRRG
jgi:Polyketide cyclase / dehydrase and lipid transport